MLADWTDFAIALPTAINLLFAFAFGACAGSFIHVLVHRLPEGLSVISPPSRCPTCGYRLPWHQNIPVIGYLRLRGHCAACGVRIPSRYVWSEVGMGLLFVAAWAVLFLPRRDGFWYPVGEGWWRAQGIAHALPALAAVWCGIGALAAMTAVDAKSFLIPVAIPGWTSVLAFLLWPLAAAVAQGVPEPFPMPAPPWQACVAALGGLAGLGIGRILLVAGILPRSFEDYGDYAANESDVFADYPHARREMMKEIAFVGPAVLLAGVGWVVAPHVAPTEALPAPLAAFFAVALGFLVGGAIVWALRIVATLLLDTEALGLGDVHLLACVGAVFGWKVAVAGFVLAPFAGLAWWLANSFRHAPMRMPYGPSLAVGSVAAWGMKPVVAAAVTGLLAWMATLGTSAKASPGHALILASILGVASTVAAAIARRAGGPSVAASIVLMVAGVVAWILAAPSWPAVGAGVGLGLAVACLAGSWLSGARFEEDAGPRTALSRILRLLAVVVVAVGLVLLVARPAGSALP